MKFIVASIILHAVIGTGLWMAGRRSAEIPMNFAQSQVIEIEFIEPLPQRPIRPPEPKPEPQKEIEPEPVEEPVKEVVNEKVIAQREVVREQEEKKPQTADTVVTEVPEVEEKPQAGAAVEVANFTHNWYLNHIRQSIYRNFDPFGNIPTDDRIVVIHFVIQQDGTITNPRFTKRSRSEMLNRLALRAVEAARLQPLPPAFVQGGHNHLGVHFTFVYENKE